MENFKSFFNNSIFNFSRIKEFTFENSNSINIWDMWTYEEILS